MKTGPSGALAQRFLDSKLTPLLVGAALVAGIGAMLITPREEEPQIRVPMIDVAAGLPGATPREVERRLAEPLERALWEIPGIEYVYSASYPDGALVTARFKVGTDPETALTRLYGKLLANMDRMPPGATPPLVKLHGIAEVPILTLTLSGGSDAGDGYLLRQQAAELAGELKRIPDVAEVWVTGGAPREVAVTLDPQALAARGLSAGMLLGALVAANAEAPAGSIVAANRTVPVRVGRLLRDAEDVQEVVVGVSGGRAVRLRDVARVTDGPAEPTQYVGFLAGGTFEPAVTIAIAKRPGTNAATIADRALRRVGDLRGRLLATDVRLTVTRNYGATASEKARELLLHILIATLGVVALVWLALGWREAGVVLVAIPVTLALTLLVYRLYGYTLNRITLFALVFAIGILVDDAIVVVENIARHLGLGERAPREAAVVAVDEVGNPTILATLTVIAAILPMAFVSGLMGPYMRPIPVGASVAMLFSLGVAFIVTPYLALRLVRPHATPAAQPATGASRDPAATGGWLARWYRRLLTGLLADRRRRIGVYGTLAGLLVLSSALVPLKLVTVKMLPFDNKSEFQLIVDMPQGTTLERTAEVAQALALAVARDRAVQDVETYVGVPAPFNFNGLVRHYFLRRGPSVADVQVNLRPKHERSEQSHAVALRLRPVVDSLARRYGAAVKLAEIPPGPPVQATLTAEIYGPDYAAQIAAADSVRSVFRRTAGVVDVDWSVEAPHAEVRAAVAEAEAAGAGTSPSDVAQGIAAAMGGATAGLLHDDRAAEVVPIRLDLAPEARGSVGELAALPVATRSGVRRLGTLAALDSGPAPTPIFHKNLRSVVYVTGDVAGRLESPVYAMLAMGDSLARIDRGLPIHWAGSPTLTERPLLAWDGEWRITYEVFRDLGVAFAAVLGLIYLLVVAWFQSFKTPLVIMAPIPLTLVGILPAHALTGAFFTATSMIGMIALAGIIVRNSILLVDFVELGLDRGESLVDAVIASGLVRARPIVLTAAAVVIGGLVMVADPIFQGLGIALISGAIVATALTLIAIPLLYYEAHR